MNVLSFLHCFFFPLFSLLFPFLLISFFFLFILNPNQLFLSLLCVCSSHAWRIRIQLGIRTRELHAYLVKILGFGKWRLAKEVWHEGAFKSKYCSTRFLFILAKLVKASVLFQRKGKKLGFVWFHQFLVKSNFLSDLIEFFKDDFLK